MGNGTIRYWMSWEEDGSDARPLKLPLPPAVKGWWCSGSTDDTVIVCAVVDVNGTESSAWEALDGFWSPVSRRFAEHKGWAKDGWMPDPRRFPVKSRDIGPALDRAHEASGVPFDEPQNDVKGVE